MLHNEISEMFPEVDGVLVGVDILLHFIEIMEEGRFDLDLFLPGGQESFDDLGDRLVFEQDDAFLVHGTSVLQCPSEFLFIIFRGGTPASLGRAFSIIQHNEYFVNFFLGAVSALVI
jgi:hypothetical protein